MAGYRYRVFLSHSTKDKPAVEELALWLIRQGLTPFLDKWDLVPGEDWMDALPKKLAASETCAVFIGVGDKGGWQSEEVKQTLLRRVRESKQPGGKPFRIVVVLLPGATGPSSDEPSAFDFLQTYTWVKFDKTLDEKEARHRLVCGIRGVSPGPPRDGVNVTSECPYRGLGVFDVAHADIFFGREKLTRDLVEMLGTIIRGPGPRLLAVVGPSGSGKSSIVRAGLIPVLKQGALDGSDNWKRLIFKPGQYPLKNLGIALASLTAGADPLAGTGSVLEFERLCREHTSSLDTAARLATRDDPPPARLLVILDQFEEVFTQCSLGSDREKLIANLIEAATVPHGPVVVILALRADFLGQCAFYRALADAISGRQMLIGGMADDEIHRAIEQPALLTGGEFEPGLIDQVLRDAGSDPGALPLLEFTMTQLWRQKTVRTMTAQDYQAIGGIRGALKQHAETVLDHLRKSGLEDICRRILLDLIEPGKGTGDIRRRVPYQQVAVSADWTTVVETLIRERLVTTDNVGDIKAGMIEIVHESLITNWETLRDWVDTNRKGIESRVELESIAERWIGKSRHPDYLLHGLPLATAQEWAKAYPEDLSRLANVNDLVGASQKADEARKEKKVSFWRRMTAVGSVLALSLLVITLIALVQTRQATMQTRVADSRLIAAIAESERGKNLDRSLILAVMSLRIENTREARNSLFNALVDHSGLSSLLDDHQHFVSSVAFSPDGKTIATGYEYGAGDVMLWDAAQRTRLVDKPLDGGGGGVMSVAFSPDGATLAAGGSNGVMLWDVQRRARLIDKPLVGGDGVINSVVFGPNGTTLAAGFGNHASCKGGVTIWDVAQRVPLVNSPMDVAGVVTSVAFSPDGKILAAAYTKGDYSKNAGDGVVLWDVAARIRLAPDPLAVTEGRVTSVAFSSDGKTLAAGYSGDGRFGRGKGGGVMLWDVSRRARLNGAPLDVSEGDVTSVDFSPDGKIIAAGYTHGIVLWQILRYKSGAVSYRLGDASLDIAGAKVTSVAFSPDGRTLASGYGVLNNLFIGVRGGVALWDDAMHTQLVEPLTVTDGRITSTTFSPDGKTLATAYRRGRSQGVILWDTARRTLLSDNPIDFSDGQISSVAFSPDSKTLAVAYTQLNSGIGLRGAVVLWNVALRTQSVSQRLRVIDGEVTQMVFSSDGKTLVASSRTGVMLWDLERGIQLLDKPLDNGDGGGGSLAFSPNCKIMATGYGPRYGDGRGVMLWNVARGTRLFDKPLVVCEGYVTSVAFGPDGKTLATGYAKYEASGVQLWDVLRRTRLLESPLAAPEGSVNCVAFSPDGLLLAAGCGNKTGDGAVGSVVLWDVSRRARLIDNPLELASVMVSSVAFSPDGKTLAAVCTCDLGQSGVVVDGETVVIRPASRTGDRVMLWDIDLNSWQRHAEKIANRNLTRAEWGNYFPDKPYQRTFERLPEPRIMGSIESNERAPSPPAPSTQDD